MISDGVRAVLAYTGKRQCEVGAEVFGMSKNTFSNKVRLDRWTAKDLTKIAAYVGGRLAIILPNGQQIFFDTPKPDE